MVVGANIGAKVADVADDRAIVDDRADVGAVSSGVGGAIIDAAATIADAAADRTVVGDRADIAAIDDGIVVGGVDAGGCCWY